jgi:hypothetical protein
MANPNLVTTSSIYGVTTYLIPTGVTATTWTALTPSAGIVHRVNFIMASNVTASAATITVTVNSAAGGGGTAYRLAYLISVPANATLIVADKSNMLYITETNSVVVTSGTSSAIEMIASYEAIS